MSDGSTWELHLNMSKAENNVGLLEYSFPNDDRENDRLGESVAMATRACHFH